MEKVVAGVEKVWRAPGKVGKVGDHVSSRILILPAFFVFFNTSNSIWIFCKLSMAFYGIFLRIFLRV